MRDRIVRLDELELDRVPLLGFSGARIAANHPEPGRRTWSLRSAAPHWLEIADTRVFGDAARAIEEHGFEAAAAEAEIKRPDILGQLRAMQPEGVVAALVVCAQPSLRRTHPSSPKSTYRQSC